MSTEQILLFVAFLVLPLAQYLLRAARQGRGREPVKADGQASSAGRPEPPELLPPAMEDSALSHAINTSAFKPGPDAARPVTSPTRRSARRTKVAVALRDPLDLRRAIVLMTLIEPCRAIRPHD